MKTLQQIKDEYAVAERGYENWDALIEQIALEKRGRGLDSLEWNMNNVVRLYAEQAIDICAFEATDIGAHKNAQEVLEITKSILSVKKQLK